MIRTFERGKSCFAIAPVVSSSSMPVSWLRAFRSAGIMLKKLPVPMEGSSTFPPSKPMRRTMSHMASTVGGSV